MNFVFVNYDYSPNFNSPREWVNRIKAYTGSLEHLGKENTVTRVEQINYAGDCSHNGVRYFFSDSGMKRALFPWQLNRFVEDLDADIVIVKGTPSPLHLLQLRFQLNKKTKIIAQYYAAHPPIGIKRLLQQIADRYVDAYVFASRALGLSWVKEGTLSSQDKIHEIPEVSSNFYPIDKEVAKKEIGVTGKLMFLWVGNLTEKKDPVNALKTFLKFARSTPDAKLYMLYYSDELLNELNDVLSMSIYKDAVELIPMVLNHELLYWYNSADFIISGPNYVGSGTSICEAMSCGCIPIVPDIPTFNMLTDNGKCGVLYEQTNNTALLAAMMYSQVINKPDLKKKSLSHFNKKLSFEAIARQITDIAESL